MLTANNLLHSSALIRYHMKNPFRTAQPIRVDLRVRPEVPGRLWGT